MQYRFSFQGFRNLFNPRQQNPKSAALICVGTVVVVYLAWSVTRGLFKNAVLFGIPLGFVLPVLIIPCFVLIILDAYARRADDIDRHTPETENE